ncbi:MAG TPA: LysR substrate-binding domain-containing protein [Devosia sp.]|nr:LysR substrate-binding domain-containing protein [Devosia sp.]
MSLRRSLMPTLSQLIAFEAVFRLGSFTRAAEELALTQGALSKQIKQLEVTIGIQLLERTKRRLTITPDGLVYVRDIRAILRRLERSTNALIDSHRKTDVFTLAVPPSFADRWLIQRLGRFLEFHPKATINCLTYATPFDFEKQPADAAIYCGREDWPDTVATRLFDEVVTPVASPAYVARLGLGSPADLERAALIHNSTRPALWHIWFDSLSLGGDRPLPGHAFDEFLTIIEAAAAGLGVALIPQFLIDDELKSGKLTIPFDHAIPSMESYFLVVPNSREGDPVVADFREALLATLGRDIPDGVRPARRTSSGSLRF